MSLGHENRYIDALHKNIAFLQNELEERNKMINSIMETQTAVLDVMTTTEYSRTEHSRPSITKTISLIKDLTITETEIIQEKGNAQEINKLESKRK